MGVGAENAGSLGQRGQRELRANRPEIAVAPGQIALLFPVGTEIGHAGLALDDPDLALRRQCHHVASEAADRHDLGQARDAAIREMPADAPREIGAEKTEWIHASM